jgi:hypothetical protein
MFACTRRARSVGADQEQESERQRDQPVCAVATDRAPQ